MRATANNSTYAFPFLSPKNLSLIISLQRVPSQEGACRLCGCLLLGREQQLTKITDESVQFKVALDESFKSILAEGAIALSVTLSGGALFAS